MDGDEKALTSDDIGNHCEDDSEDDSLPIEASVEFRLEVFSSLKARPSVGSRSTTTIVFDNIILPPVVGSMIIISSTRSFKVVHTQL